MIFKNYGLIINYIKIYMKKIFENNWFKNRDNLGKYNFDKSGAIYDFSKNTVSKTLWGKSLNDLIKHPRNIESEFEGINSLINRNKFAKVTLSNSSENEFYTDGETIVLSSKPIIDFGIPGFDILLGALVHEASHIRFTNFNLPENKKLANNQAIHWIWNLLEDEVIEQMLQIEKPGLGNVLGPIKDYMFESNKISANDDYDLILYTLFSLIRYPKNIQNVPEEWLDSHNDLFENIFKILQKNNVLNISIKENCSKETYQSAIEIYKLICQEKNNKIDKNGNESGESGESLTDKFDENGKPSDSVSSDMKSTTIGDSTLEQTSGKDLDKIQNKINSSNQISHKDLNEKLKDILDKQNNSGGSGKSNENPENSNRGSAPCGFLKQINWNNSDEQKYNNLYNYIKPYIKLIRGLQINRENKILTYHKTDFNKNGQLTGRTLAQAFQGVKNVYSKIESKIGKEKIQKFSLVLAIDESGSMTYDNMVDLASSLGIMFAEAFRENDQIEVFVYGHSEYIVNYIDPHTKTYYSLAKRHQGGGQNEVLAYNTIIKDVLSKANSDILLVNITDSQYLANYSDIENEMKKWSKKIYQSLITVGSQLNKHDIKINDKIYGKNNWAHICDLKSEKTKFELRKLIKYLNKLAKNSHRNKK